MNEADDVIKMLDNLTQTGVSRIKVETSEEIAEGDRKKAYHHGRCDVGSPNREAVRRGGAGLRLIICILCQLSLIETN